MFIGHLVPTIIGLRKHLAQNTDDIMASLAKALLDVLTTRFDPVLNSLEYNLATMLLPQFRLSCIFDDEKVGNREQLQRYVRHVQMEIGQIVLEMRRSQPKLGLHNESTTSTASNI